jgi:large subunit ribosomal protein L25
MLNMAQDTISLTLEKREVLGKAVRHLRKSGKVPAVIHDHGKDSIIVQVDTVQMMKVWKEAGKHHPVQLKAGDKDYVALIKTAEFDPRKNLLTHVVFNAVDRNQKVEAEVPVRPRYAEGNESSPAERNSLIVLSQLETVQVKAIATNLPDVFEYDAEKLIEVGDHVTVADLIVPEGVEIETELNQSIATVYEPSALAAANEASAGDAEEATEAEGDETAADGEAPAAESSESVSDKTDEAKSE